MDIIRDTTKLLPGGFYFTNMRGDRGKNIYREVISGAMFTMYCGQRTYLNGTVLREDH